MFAILKQSFGHLLEVPEDISPGRYRSLRRLMTLLMVAVSVTPLLLLSAISHLQYTRTLGREMESPVYALARKSQAALELYLGERVSTVGFLAHAYTFEDLADERTLNRVFLSLKSEFQGFVDMGLVDAEGRQVGYVGPYKLKGADYAGKPWLREAEIKGRYLSNAFLGYRGYPHLVVAVHRLQESGQSWTLRVATDTLRAPHAGRRTGGTCADAGGPRRRAADRFQSLRQGSGNPAPVSAAGLARNCGAPHN